MRDIFYAVTIPKWGMEMQEGTIVNWHVVEGTVIEKGDDLIDIETDKIVNTMEAPASGTLLKYLANDGDTLDVGQLIAVIGPADQGNEAIDAYITEFKPADTSTGSERANESAVSPSLDKPLSPKETTTPPAAGSGKVRVSPAAARRARELGIDVVNVTGTGRGGRISTEDVERHAAENPSVKTANEPGSAAYLAIQLSPIRKIIAKKLLESKTEIPHFYLTAEIKMDEAITCQKNAGVSVNDVVVRATVLALQVLPELNIHLIGDEIRQFQNINMAIAVATDEGLVTPVVKEAESLTLKTLSKKIKYLGTRARSNELTPGEMRDATFTVSNLGMYGISEFQAIINPPQGAILAVGAVIERCVPDGDNNSVKKMMNVSLSCDHRAIDGALGAKFLQEIKRQLENPSAL